MNETGAVLRQRGSAPGRPGGQRLRGEAGRRQAGHAVCRAAEPGPQAFETVQVISWQGIIK